MQAVFIYVLMSHQHSTHWTGSHSFELYFFILENGRYNVSWDTLSLKKYVLREERLDAVQSYYLHAENGLMNADRRDFMDKKK